MQMSRKTQEEMAYLTNHQILHTIADLRTKLLDFLKAVLLW